MGGCGFPAFGAPEGARYGGATKGWASLGRMTCSECESEISNGAWSCPHCGNPVETAHTGKEISSKGMTVLLLLFVFFPVLLFLIHIFVPNM